METITSVRMNEIAFHSQTLVHIAGPAVTEDFMVLDAVIVPANGTDRHGNPIRVIQGSDRDGRPFVAMKGPNHNDRWEGEWFIK